MSLRIFWQAEQCILRPPILSKQTPLSKLLGDIFLVVDLSERFAATLEQVLNHLHQEGTDWIFNPLSSSYMGGIWERQIRTARKVLTVVLHEHGSRLDDESFRTLSTM